MLLHDCVQWCTPSSNPNVDALCGITGKHVAHWAVLCFWRSVAHVNVESLITIGLNRLSRRKEEIPLDAPAPKGKPVSMTSFFDANLHHDLVSGKSVTGVLHQLNKTPIDWCSKLQSTVETATFGSECVAARTCNEQVIDLRLTLWHLGAPINGPTMVLGDNESVINSAAIPHSKMHKRWVALFCHQVRHAVAVGIINIHHIAGKKNPADVLSKHWDLPSVWNTMKQLLFWNWKLMAPSAEEAKEGSNIEQKDVAELVSKPSAMWRLQHKANVKRITFSSRGVTMVQFHPWFSPRIGVVSRVPDQELMCALKEKTQDPMRNTKWIRNESSHDVFHHDVVQSYGHVVTRVSHHDETCAPCKQSCQWRCRSCWKTQSYFYGSLMLITFKFACKSICSFDETLE